MSRWVVYRSDSVAVAGQYNAIRSGQNGTNRNLVALSGRAGFGQCKLHLTAKTAHMRVMTAATDNRKLLLFSRVCG